MTSTDTTRTGGRPHLPGGARPAVLVSDLDGTLLDADRKVAERTRRALTAAVESGVHLVLATARPAWSARQVLLPLRGLGASLVSSNGAVTGDLDDPRPRRVRTMAPARVREALGLLGPVPWAVDRPSGRLLGPDWPDILSSGGAGAPRAEEVPDGEEVLCLMARRASPPSPSFLAPAGLCWTSSDAGLVEVSAPGADKRSAVSWLLDSRGLDWSAVVAFGDAPNDMSLLRSAATGVAMANAVSDVRSSATELTAGHDEDGVAMWVERNLL
ncbi:HAD hydrolase family protein [Streptomyces sp. NBC_00053]|uniref:HAD family hydrolase n=1 Tax=unclassified Streptomyces TaxID=2593676 RepID=UPI000F9590AB|nr:MULTISPECIES: HAD hydrolase family protein [unclassified Streptomyces]WSG54056.1 HAD hydrolase family protein [Streptomyces sp. NBC_01732]WSX04686.1 HAD hydrolase family protein [Streptomyces sp. NBC_00987]MCX4393039.1 HAD hydrolase family protein [Streptomyces sp. NBC_01767]MCX5105154.1 HAD hydrolase family protein [Streptomyces sp. NBC_00439]MCX5163690.1 HAD hydrolase family protein [Streptomyces sp. NBC_00305]